jgi:hypothetical protein
MDFFINKNATLPLLVMELIQDGRNDYKEFHELIQNANIYFSMTNIETGVRKISKKDASCLLKEACVDCPEEYYVIYAWEAKDTNKCGTYKGEFIFEFLDGSGTLIAPIRDELFIHIRDGAIKNC